MISNQFPHFADHMLSPFQVFTKCPVLSFTYTVVNVPFLSSSIAAQSNMVMQPAPVTNPFGTLPAAPQMSIGRVGAAPSVQYGISNMPVRFFFSYFIFVDLNSYSLVL